MKKRREMKMGERTKVVKDRDNRQIQKTVLPRFLVSRRQLTTEPPLDPSKLCLQPQALDNVNLSS